MKPKELAYDPVELDLAPTQKLAGYASVATTQRHDHSTLATGPTEQLAMLAGSSPTRPDRDPVNVYLARLTTKESRRTMQHALEAFAQAVNVDDPHRISWAALGYQHVELLRTMLAERLSAPSVNKILSAVRGVARQAMRLKILGADEYTLIADVEGLPNERLPAGRHLEEPEIGALFATCDTRAQGIRDRAMLAVLRVTGCRRAELASLDLSSLDRSWGLRLRGKGNKERMAYVAEAQADLLAWLDLRGRAHGPMFCRILKSGILRMGRMSPSSVSLIVKRAKDRAEIDGASPHDFRRTFIGNLLDGGADLSTAQKLAGHSSVTTTQRYDRRPERAAAQAAAMIKLPPR